MTRNYKYPDQPTIWKKLEGKKTVLFNLFIVIVGGLTMLYKDGANLSEDDLKLVALFVAIGNLFLRFLTDAPITVQNMFWRKRK